MYFTGLIIALSTFFIMGLFHPIVIKSEYYFGARCWPVFAVLGVVFVAVSVVLESVVLSSISGVVGASCFWSIGELFAQRKRVERGWFPKREPRQKKS